MKTYKSVFISDTHLGSKHCRSEELLDFLKDLKCENLFLVGDIIDGWRLQKKWYWPTIHSKIIQQIFKMSSKGMNIFYLTGNHDEFLRTFTRYSCQIQLGNITVKNRIIYDAVNGHRYLVIHGDLFDHLMKSRVGRKVMTLGDWAYDFFSYISLIINWTRKKMGMRYWSLVKFLKNHAKSASNFIGNYEHDLSAYCKSKGYHGIICGHIHSPTIRNINGVEYMNDGDWVENGSALVEHLDGTWEIIMRDS